MTDALPPGWISATLPELVDTDGLFVDGDWIESKDQDPEGDVRLIQLADVGDGQYIDKSNRFLTSAKAAKLRCTFLRSGDVLIARMPDPLGRACIFPGDPRQSVTVVDVAVFRGGVDHSWLMYTLNAEQSRRAIAALASGTTRSRISRGNLSTIRFPLAPLNEQHRIVAKLDAIFEQTRAAKARLDRLPSLLDDLRRSILATAFRGDLTADWRATHPDVEPGGELLGKIRVEHRRRWEDDLRAKGRDPSKSKFEEPSQVATDELPTLPRGWAWAPAQLVVEPGTVITYGIVLPGKHVDGGVPYVRQQDIQDGSINVLDLLRTSPEIAAKYERSTLRTGDILLCIIRHRRVAIVPPGLDGANITQGAVRLRPGKWIRGAFLAVWLESPVAQRWMEARVFGLDMPRINVGDAREVPVPLPPLAEQDRIVELLGAARARVSALVDAHASSTRLIDQLECSALAKAFRGELVDQNPNDEPASALLERMRTSLGAVQPRAARQPRSKSNRAPCAGQRQREPSAEK